MQVPGKLLIVGTIGCAVAGALIDWQFNSREVIKTVTVDHEVIKWHTIRETHEVTNPDGSKTRDEREVTDGTKTDDIIKTIVDKKASEMPQWLVAVGVSINAERVKTYSTSVDRRILGPATLGAYATTNSELGLRVGFQF